MRRGEKSWILKSRKFDEHIRKLLSVICGKNYLNGIGPKLLIMSYLTRVWNADDFEAYCTDCGIFDLKFTRSGRTIVAPMRLSDEKFVKGSGISGCDHYDGGYDNGVIKDGQQDYASNANLTDFIVDDDEPVDSTMHCKQEISDSEEGEWSDYASDEEEGFDSDMDWD